MHIYDSVKKSKLKFEPIKKDAVLIYVCGPTVYDDAHLGHARSSLVFDLLRRTLINIGYKVNFVKNFTDIDDKIINKMKQSKQSLSEITNFYINSYKNDMQKLNIKDADLEPKATNSLDVIVEFIQTLLENENAYLTENGVYFDTSKDKNYLCISHRHIEDNDTRSRIGNDSDKKNPKDFALWKLTKNDELSFPSPFGAGRPGWHIECSAMIKKHLGYKDEKYQIDIHAGGADLLFPHHENEAAQTRMESKQELSKYWMHNGFVNINGEKMSKSLGNSFFLKDIFNAYDGELIRFYLLMTHYRADLNFNEEDLIQSKKRLDKIYRLKRRVGDISPNHEKRDFANNLVTALKDDLNISKALAVIDEMINEVNDTLDKNPKNTTIKEIARANILLINELLGVGEKEHTQYFQLGLSEHERKKIETLIKQRDDAKKIKDFISADKIRDLLIQNGVSLLDTINGTQWEKLEN